MKQVTKKSLLSFLVVALLAIVCAFGVMGFNRSNTALASEALPEASVYQAATLADEADFSIKAGAGVETTTTGIKFTAIVSETFAEAGYSYFATAQVKGGTYVEQVAFTAAPVFVDGTAEICAYINGFGELNDAQKAAAAKAEWIVNAYAYNDTTCIKAANGGEDNLQSMGMVAASAALDYTSPEVDGYDKEDITSYFVKSNFAEGVNGYADESGMIHVSFAGAPVDATEIYINGVAAVTDYILYNEDNARYWIYDEAFGAEPLNTVGKAVLFTEDGGVYATKIARGTPIASEDDMKTYFTGDVEGYYYLTSDIAMASAWNVVANLYGTFDGQGYTISNMKYTHSANYKALFDPYGGTVKNLGLEVISTSYHSGLIFGQGGDKQDSTIDNVFVITRLINTPRPSLFQLSAGGHHTIKNAIVIRNRTDANASSYAVNCHTNPASDTTPSTWTIENVHATANGPMAYAPAGANKYDDFLALKKATDGKRSFEQERAIAQLKPWIAINQDNASEIQNFTAGQLMYLEEDVNVSSVAAWAPAQARLGSGIDSRVFIGDGHTVSGLNITTASTSVFGGARGITVKNAGFHFAKLTSTNGGGLFGNVTASTNVIEDVVLSFDTFNASAAGALLRNPEKNSIFNVKNLLVHIGGAAAGSNAGLLLGNLNQVTTINLDNVAFIRDPAGITNIKLEANTNQVINGGYASYDSIAAFLAADGVNETLVAYAKQFGVVTTITQANAKDIFGAGLTSGYYYLEEDIDLDGADFIPGSNVFTGYFDGNGHVIRNFKTNGLFAGSMNGKATIKNVGVQGVSQNNKTGGIFASQSNSGNSSNILIENVVINMHAVEGSFGLLGESVGMKVTFKNVVMNFENSNSTSAGYVGATSMSGTKIFDKFIGIGSIATATTPGGSNATYVNGTKAHTAGFYGRNSTNWGIGYEYGADGASAPVLGKDLYNFANYAAFEAQLETDAFGLSEEALALIAKTGLVRKITAENIATLQYASNGTYYLEEDIDMSQIDLNGDGICNENDIWTGRQSVAVPFAGVLDGQGHSITNLRLGGKNYNGFFSNVGGGALIKNIKIEAVSQAHLNATLIGKIETGFKTNSTHTLTDGRVAGQINVVNTVLSSADLAGTKALVTVFYNATPSVILTDVVLMATGTYDDGYAVTDGGGNSINLTVNNVLVIVADSTTAQWYADTQTPALTGELVYAADSTVVDTMYTGKDVVLGFFGLDPK